MGTPGLHVKLFWEATRNKNIDQGNDGQGGKYTREQQCSVRVGAEDDPEPDFIAI